MAAIVKRKNKKGKTLPGWKAIVRIQGHPTICRIWDRKEEAEDWAKDIELQIKDGSFNFGGFKQKHTFDDLIVRYVGSGALEHHKAVDDTHRHLQYWQARFKSYAIIHLTPESIAKERQFLVETPTVKGCPRSPSTVNRYIAALSSVLTYACRELRWLDDNPCFNLIKLKEPAGGQLQEPFSARDVYHGKHWSGLASSEEVQEVLGYLCEHNYLMQHLVKTGGKPTTKYWVHPDVFKQT